MLGGNIGEVKLTFFVRDGRNAVVHEVVAQCDVCRLDDSAAGIETVPSIVPAVPTDCANRSHRSEDC